MTSLYLINGNSFNNGYLMGNVIPVNTEPQYQINKYIYIKQSEPDHHFIQNGNTFTIIKNTKAKSIHFVNDKKESKKINIKLEISNKSSKKSLEKKKSYNWPLV